MNQVLLCWGIALLSQIFWSQPLPIIQPSVLCGNSYLQNLIRPPAFATYQFYILQAQAIFIKMGVGINKTRDTRLCRRHQLPRGPGIFVLRYRHCLLQNFTAAYHKSIGGGKSAVNGVYKGIFNKQVGVIFFLFACYKQKQHGP
jgi:hypothetical protein